MATSLLRLGRLGTLKCLGQDGRGSLRTPLTAAFCSKAEAPKKPAKKTSSKTLEAPDERAALLAYKTTVAFPTRLSTAGFLSQGVALGEHDQSRASSEESITGADAKRAESVTDDSAKAETESYDVGAAAEATPVAETATEKDTTSPPSADVEAPKSKATPKDDDTSSSSSSSDSDSDSDSDDEKPDKTEKPEPVAKTGDKPGQEEMLSSVSKQPSSDVKTGAVLERVQPCFADEALKGAVKRAPQAAEAVSEPTSKEVPAPSTAAAPAEEIIDPAHVLCTAESIKTQAEVIPEKEAGAEVKSSEVPDAVTEGAPDVAAGHAPEAVLDSAPKAASEAGLEIKAAPETMQAVTPAEELGDPAPVITAAEGVRAEPEVAAAPEEAAAAPAPKPQPEPEPEPFDNTSYKNLQHHNYNIYTFVDMDVEMAKHRLPQPSTGRPSPRH